MIPEWGVFSLILALFFGLMLTLLPGFGIIANKPVWTVRISSLVYAQAFFIALAYLSLTWCFLTDDFSVVYVVNNSSRLLPWFYKLCAVWGGHEGSMLLWVAILSAWTVLVCRFSRSLDPMLRVRILVVLGALSVGFLIFLLAASNPFLRQFGVLNAQGKDLNPLLQDIGFLFHPPMLYMGYVGFSVAFAFAIAALWSGKVESSWAKWTRPWTLAAWCCLTAGITLGSWWAYRELGWGGWWFWDPVENASFMPWLVGTALIHSLAVCETRKSFLAWTLLLALIAFALSLVGTFLVRSGVLTSVHAFAVDPARGLTILGFLLIVVGGSLLLFIWRAPMLTPQHTPSWLSREAGLLLNNVFLSVIMLTVLMGTVYPLLVDGLGLGKLSVGAPYFNAVFVPLMIPLLLVMGAGIHLRWGHDSGKRLVGLLWPVLGVSGLAAIAALLLWGGKIDCPTLLGLVLAFWIMLSTVWWVIRRVRSQGARSMRQALWGMVIAHWGVAVSVIGVAVSSGYGNQQDVKMSPGEALPLAGYNVKFIRELPLKGPNYEGTRAVFTVTHASRTKTIYPEKRLYSAGQNPMTDSAIDVNPFRDIYVALGEPLGDAAWSVRLYYKPFIRWIWAGGFLMLAGGLLAMTDRRYSMKKEREA